MEKTVPLPLSGTEVRLALLDKIDQKLQKDCFLHPNAAYDFFDGTVSIDIKLHDVPRGEADSVKVEATLKHGEAVPNPETVTAGINLEQEPPNKVRIETGQPVPTSSGKKIRYGRNVAEKVVKEEQADEAAHG